jgi:hypothetical protein
MLAEGERLGAAKAHVSSGGKDAERNRARLHRCRGCWADSCELFFGWDAEGLAGCCLLDKANSTWMPPIF